MDFLDNQKLIYLDLQAYYDTFQVLYEKKWEITVIYTDMPMTDVTWVSDYGISYPSRWKTFYQGQRHYEEIIMLRYSPWQHICLFVSIVIHISPSCSNEQLYKNFIVTFVAKLSQVKLAVLVSKVSHSYSDPFESLMFLQSVIDSNSKNGKQLSPEAKICIDMDKGNYYVLFRESV